MSQRSRRCVLDVQKDRWNSHKSSAFRVSLVWKRPIARNKSCRPAHQKPMSEGHLKFITRNGKGMGGGAEKACGGKRRLKRSIRETCELLRDKRNVDVSPSTIWRAVRMDVALEY